MLAYIFTFGVLRASLVINLYLNVPPIYVPEIYDEDIYRISVNVYGRYSTPAHEGMFPICLNA